MQKPTDIAIRRRPPAGITSHQVTSHAKWSGLIIPVGMWVRDPRDSTQVLTALPPEYRHVVNNSLPLTGVINVTRPTPEGIAAIGVRWPNTHPDTNVPIARLQSML